MGQTHTCADSRMQLNLFFFLFFPLASSSLLLPGERVEIFARALHSLIPGHGAWSEVLSLKESYLRLRAEESQWDPDTLPYFKFIPKYKFTATPGSEKVPVDGTCFSSAEVTSATLESGDVEVTLHLGLPTSLLCHASFILATDKHIELEELWLPGDHTITFPAITNSTPAEDWDLYTRGPRIFLYPISPEEVTYNLAATLALFEPCLTQGVTDYFANLNREFLKAFVGIEMPERDGAPDILEVPEELIKNGDTFDIMRLDGLDPMIAWAMGASTGHTAVALWREGTLQICESNALSPYWPTNGIQCNPYLDWLEFGRLAGYNTVWAPLSAERSGQMDVTAAWDFIDSMMGVDYGYEVVLTGLIDTLYDNMPCANKDSTGCLEPEHLELLMSVGERLSEEAARILKPAIMQRAGVQFDHPTGILEAYYQAHLAGVEPTELAMIPEQDGWLYHTTREGTPTISPVMICNVFVCNVWKAAGLFADINNQINCGETSVNDNYRLAHYSTAPVPEICSDVDPENKLCQVLGKFSLRLDSQPGVLPRFNYIQPKEGMFENCPSVAPDYLAPTDC